MASTRPGSVSSAVACVLDRGHRHGDGPAQTSAAAACRTPTAELPRRRGHVRIDAVVTDRNGHVVSDLTADDFEVRQDGKVQRLSLAHFYPVADAGAPSAAARWRRRPTLGLQGPPCD